MTLNRPIWMQAGGADPTFEYSAQNLRSAYSAITAQEGVFWGLAVTQRAAGANFSVDIAAGQAVIAGDDVTSQGHYIVYNTADAYNVVIPAAPVSGSRTHRVIAQVQDKLHEGTYSDYDWDVVVQEDTGSGTPALPDSAIPLATVTVTSATTSITSSEITDARIRAHMHPALDESVAGSSTRPVAPVEREQIWRADVDYHEVYTGAAWAVLPNSLHGPAWTSYTPTLTATSSNPTLGTGSSATGEYMRHGRMVTVRATIKFGTSGAAAGSGTYKISLPITAKTLTAGYHVGSATGLDNSTGDDLMGVCRSPGAASYGHVEMVLSGELVVHNSPYTWAVNDLFSVTITYEAAS